MNTQHLNGFTSAVVAPQRSEGERSEPARSAGATTAGAASRRPNPEVVPRAKRRTFPAPYKQQILAEADAASGTGDIGALLRREGLYSSHLTHWRQERAIGITQALAPRKRGPKPVVDPSLKRVQQLLLENERLAERLRKAEIIIDVQKKIASLLGLSPAAPVATELI